MSYWTLHDLTSAVLSSQSSLLIILQPWDLPLGVHICQDLSRRAFRYAHDQCDRPLHLALLTSLLAYLSSERPSVLPLHQLYFAPSLSLLIIFSYFPS